MVTVLTRTIGPSGRDYASFTLAEADVTNIGTSADLVANDEAIVFEADAGTYDEQLVANSTLTTDPTRNVTYKAAAGSEHGGAADAGVILYRNAAGQNGTQLYDDYTNLIGLNLYQGVATAGRTALFVYADGCFLDSCIITTSGGLNDGVQLRGLSAAAALTLHNTVIDAEGIGLQSYPSGIYAHSLTATNVTVVNQASTSVAFALPAPTSAEFVNCLVLRNRAVATAGAVTLTGSNNFGGATNPFPVAIQGSPYPITPTTSFSTPLGSGDYAVYMGATGALADVTGNDVWQQGVGPASNSDVPTTDINGVTRSGTSCNPGAFEADGFVAPTVLTRTIGSGKDYSTFTLAEAAVTSIGSGTDLTFYNEAIVFEADAGSYPSSLLFFDSTLTTDPTRNVTYKPASGSEHSGVFGAGVFLDVTVAVVRDSHTALDGIGGTTVYAQNGAAGVTIRNGVWRIFDTGASGSGTADYPTVFENCVSYFTTGSNGFTIRNGASYPIGYYRMVNCTVVGAPAKYGFAVYPAFTTLEVEFTNCIVLGALGFADISGGTAVITGSNNFDDGTRPFPVALRGAPWPVTPTTDTDPGAGDWAIYQASNGQLYHVPDNDVWGQGVGPTANSDVPTTDIVGAARSGSTANPGAFETGVPPSISTNQLVAPNGRLEADTISHIDQYTYVVLEKSGALTGGETVSYIWYYKVDSTLAAGAGETVTFSMKDFGGAVIEEINWAVAYDDATPTVALGSTTTAGSGYTVSALSYAAVSNDWVRCSITLTDHSSRGRDVVVTHTSMMGAASAGTIYGVTIWGSEVTTLDRTPTANDLRPVSGGIVDFDAYPPEHRSLFASYTDLGDNNYRVTTTLTDDGSTTDYVQIEHFQANSADTTHQIYLSNPTLEDPDLELQALLINPPLPTAAWFEIPLITHATHELGNDGRVPTMVNSTNYYASHLGWGSDEGAAEDEPSPYGGDKITVIVPPVRGTGFP